MIHILITEIDSIILDDGRNTIKINTKYLWDILYNIAESMIQKKFDLREGESLTLEPPFHSASDR